MNDFNKLKRELEDKEQMEYLKIYREKERQRKAKLKKSFQQIKISLNKLKKFIKGERHYGERN